MSDCTAGLNLNHQVVNTKKEKEVINFLNSILEVDNDLTENEDYFRDDTIKLGYESEAERIISEYVSKHGLPKTPKAFRKAVVKVSDSITEQGYYGSCELDMITIGDSVVVAFATGGSSE